MLGRPEGVANWQTRILMSRKSLLGSYMRHEASLLPRRFSVANSLCDGALATLVYWAMLPRRLFLDAGAAGCGRVWMRLVSAVPLLGAWDEGSIVLWRTLPCGT